MISVQAIVSGLTPEEKDLLWRRLSNLDARSRGVPRPIVPSERPASGALPLSFSQLRLWFLHQLDPHSPLYNIPIAVRIRGALDNTALERSLNEVVRRHEALRTTFAYVDGQPAQVISPVHHLHLALQDGSQFPDAEVKSRIERLCTSEARQAFDLASGPLLRFRLLRVSALEHILLLTIHHIVSDGWSMGILLQEIGMLYEAFAENRPSPLPDLSIQYADYALWQQKRIQSDDFKTHLAYWKQKLAGAPPLSAFPTDLPRPRVLTFGGSHYSASIPLWLTERLKDLGRQNGTTLFMTLLAAFTVLLNRCTGQDDLLVGSPIANRSRPEIEPLIGFFVNTLVFRTDLSGDPTFRELLSRVRKTATESYAHQDVPFEKLVEELRPERDLSHSPLFQVMFVLQNAPRPRLSLSDLTLELLEVDSGTSKFDITLSMEETENGMTAYYEYNSALFDRETIARMAARFETLLEGVASDPNRRVSSLPLLGEDERNRILGEWNPAPAEPVEYDSFQSRFEQQARTNPDVVAVAFEDRHLTYKELNARANRLAHYLREQGVGPETLVGISVDRSPEMIVALLSILKAGGAYLPLDPRYPIDRLAFMMDDSRVSLVLTQREIARSLPAHSIPLVCLDDEWDSIATRPATDLECVLHPDNLAYVIYTSGTTGRPKGVLVAHRGLTNLIDTEARIFQHGPGSRLLQFASLSFDGATCEIVRALAAGATLHIARSEELIPGPNLARFLQEQSITLATLPPSALAVLPEGTELPALKTVTVAGEACRAEVLARWLPGRRFLNLYGPTEATVCATTHEVFDSTCDPPIGRPISNVSAYILDTSLQPAPIGVPGELHIGGVGVARGYLGRPDLTAERFIPDPFGQKAGDRLYKTGDLARYRSDGNIEFLGRIDQQVKIRGFRVELGEIESVLGQHPGVGDTAVVLREDVPGDQRLVAYVVPRPGTTAIPGDLKNHLLEKLPDYMSLSSIVVLEKMPLSPNGKIDRKSLPPPDLSRPDVLSDYVEPKDEHERTISAIWKEVLRVERVGANDNFFDLGGHSLLLAQVHQKLTAALGRDLPMVDLFKYPTVTALAMHLARGGDVSDASAIPEHRGLRRRESLKRTGTEIAVVGIACRFPGAGNVQKFWMNLCDGVESISRFTEEQLEAAGVEPRLLRDPSYVKARGVLDNVDEFDSSFFGFSPREAEITDPQHRIFLECAWEALEDAGCDPERFRGDIGVYAGTGMNTYVLNLLQNRDVVETVGPFQMMIGNDKDFLAPRVSYKLGLTGPSISVQTACSSSLVAAHMACQSLLFGECDVALAGGVSIRIPQETGYLHQEGSVFSPDGHCRAFDSKARGMAGGNGAGVVVLKRLSDAIADGDHVYAMIKGSAVNNDGALKVGFTAPSVGGQAKVIAEALYMANVDPATLTYVEAHGTGTELGDPIEIAALTQAFGGRKGEHPTCAIGSLKTNIGHLDTAAGVAGLIKASLALYHKRIPPSLHFETPNPKCGFEKSPFYVSTVLREWENGAHPRRAGVSSLGIGGTNAHMVLEEAPAAEVSESNRPMHLITLSAREEAALADSALRLAAHLESHPETSLADVAYTLHVGRKAFDHRAVLVCSDTIDAHRALGTLSPERVLFGTAGTGEPSVAFMFTGQGAQYVEMGADLYRTESFFREQVSSCAELLAPHIGLDLRTLLYPAADDSQRAAEQLCQTRFAQPVLFTIEYALARLWMEWGIRPRTMIGHSIGEYVAACLAGVIPLKDALELVAVRGRLMQSAPAGAMLSVPLSETELDRYLCSGLSLAAVNSPNHCVVAGATDSINALRESLAAQGIGSTLLQVSHAFHSSLMDSVIDPFAAVVRRLELRPPRIPFVSNLSGEWIKAGEATDPAYWARHLRGTVRFSDGVKKLLENPDCLLIEAGPGNTLCTLAKQQAKGSRVILSSMRHPHDQRSDSEHLLSTLGKLWLAGVRVDWAGYHRSETRRRVSLPTYPFQRQSYWVQPRDLLSMQQRPGTEETGPARARHARPNLGSTYLAPRNETEEAIAEMWQDLLGLHQVSVTDNFFDLGGHSLLATQLLSRIREKLHIEIPLRSLFDSPTVAGLSELVRAHVDEAEQEDLLGALLGEIEGLSTDELRAAIADEEAGNTLDVKND